jgi:hypothetical protein
MNIKSFLLSLILILSISDFIAQSNKEVTNVKTKMDEFTSKKGVILKFTDYKLSNIKDKYNSPTETKIRKIEAEATCSYFYQIILKGKYGSSTASIEYTDVMELLKALDFLKNSEQKDIINNPEYLENKFITDDGFELGYYVSNGKSVWYLVLEKYGTDKTIYIENPEIISIALNEAKNKILELKNK